jgi:beta-phosphoglucomutase-like phosphatase (HAD superfamily)
MSKHTPGPWHYQEKSDAYTHIVRAGERRFITQLSQDTSGEAEANARLMAAAPELLESAKSLLIWAILAANSDNARGALNAIADIRTAVAVIEKAGANAGIRMEGITALEKDAEARK